MSAELILDMPAATYHADPCERPSLSSSLVRTILSRSCRHAWLEHPRLNPEFVREEADKFDLGTAAHALLLEGKTVFEVCPFDSWRTKEAQAMKATARLEGKTPLLSEQAERVNWLVARAVEQIEAQPQVRGIAWYAEPVILWEEQGVHCRARLDRLADMLKWIMDYKTTSASAQPDAWIRQQMAPMGYDVQAAWYLRGARALGRSNNEFVFAVQEEDTGEMSFVGMSPAMLELANRKVDLALAKWRHCMDSGYWPAYPTQICWAEPPAWQFTKVEELELEHEMRPVHIDGVIQA